MQCNYNNKSSKNNPTSVGQPFHTKLIAQVLVSSNPSANGASHGLKQGIATASFFFFKVNISSFS